MGGPQQGGRDDAERPESLCGQRQHSTKTTPCSRPRPPWKPYGCRCPTSQPGAGAVRTAGGAGPEGPPDR
eukprot:567605-Alexandrium_andersonii.AAC.1